MLLLSEGRKPMGKGTEGRRGSRTGEAVERKPDGVAEERAARAAGREPVDARTGEPVEGGRLERPEVHDENEDRDELADSGDRQPHDHSS
jgi:hypothetical protein